MTYSGHCHCGAIHYEVTGEAQHVVLCHCADCRRSAGAPVVAWAAFAEAELRVTRGSPRITNSSGTAMRSFCTDCGTGLFYRNAVALPGIVDIQTATLADPDALPPSVHIQTAERLGWMAHAHELPVFERYPG